MKDTIPTEGHIHKGHRERMREKLSAHGPRIFASYELLEMLLFYALPQGNTNPTAKRLIYRFGSLDGVFSASKEELMSVEGVGERVADFLLSVGRATDLGYMTAPPPTVVFDDYNSMGNYFLEYFEDNTDTNIAILLLDSSMRMLGIDNMPGENFASGAVKPRDFIDAAMRRGATAAVIAYTHRNGLPYPYSGDYETAKLMRAELRRVGVVLMELYTVGGGKFTSANMQPSFSSSPSPAMEHFMKTKGANAV